MGYELISAIGGDVAVYVDTDAHYLGPRGYYKYGTHPGFQQFASRKGLAHSHLGQINVADLHGTEELLFPTIYPVELWTFEGLAAGGVLPKEPGPLQEEAPAR